MKLTTVFYVDVDDTLIRYAGTKRMPIPNVVAHVRQLCKGDAILDCWSTNGADYARSIARELGVENCFAGFLPKPNVLIDDQEVSSWKRFVTVHPMEIEARSVDEYRGRDFLPALILEHAKGPRKVI